MTSLLLLLFYFVFLLNILDENPNDLDQSVLLHVIYFLIFWVASFRNVLINRRTEHKTWRTTENTKKN
jgi:uncharacterized protein YhhL (DUF1145 family)